MLSFLPSMLATTGPALSWLPILGAVALAVLLFYLGVAMAVALFGPNDASCRRAHAIFSELLGALTRRPR